MNHSSSNNEDLREEFKNLIIKIEPYYVALKLDPGIYEVLLIIYKSKNIIIIYFVYCMY